MRNVSNDARADIIYLINQRIAVLRSESMAILKTNMVDYHENDRANTPAYAVGNLNRIMSPLEQDLLENTFRIDELYRLRRAVEDSDLTQTNADGA